MTRHAHWRMYVYTCRYRYSKLSGYGRRKHNAIQAFSVWHGTVYYISGPLRSADPTAGGGRCGIIVHRA